MPGFTFPGFYLGSLVIAWGAPSGSVYLAWRGLSRIPAEFIGATKPGDTFWKSSQFFAFDNAWKENDILFDGRRAVDGNVVYFDAKPDDGWFSALRAEGLLHESRFARAVADEVSLQHSVVSAHPGAELHWYVESAELAAFISEAVAARAPHVLDIFRVVGPPPTCILRAPEPLPELPTDSIAPLLDLPADEFFERLHEYSLKFRPSGSEDDADPPFGICEIDSNVVFRFDGDGDPTAVETYFLPEGLPLIKRDGKVFFPAERHALKGLGIDGWSGRSNMFGDGEEVLYLGNHEHVIATIPNTGYTLWDLQLRPDGLETFLTDDGKYFYFDLTKVVAMLGGWVSDWSQSTDGLVHIGIPQDPGSWFKSCQLRGFSGSKLADCPNNQWVVGSTWEYYFNEPGHEPDAYSSIMMVQGTIWKFGLGTGKDPAKNWTLQNVDIAGTLNAVGCGYEYAQRGVMGTYGEYWLPMSDFLLETALMEFDVVLQTRGWKYFNKWGQDPAKTVRLAEEARVIAKEEQYFLGARANEIRAYVLENGLNIIEENGKFRSLPVTTLPEKTVAGRQARVYGVRPGITKGGFYNQAKITGQPDPIFFTLDGKNYVLSFEYAAEAGGRALDGVGRPVRPEYPSTVAFVEVKAGYQGFIDPQTGDFNDEFQAGALARMIETFRQDILQAQAMGLEAWQVFTQQDVANLFLKHAEERLGKAFMDQYRHRVVVTTQKFIEPLTSDEPIKPTPLPPCPDEACPNVTKEVGK